MMIFCLNVKSSALSIQIFQKIRFRDEHSRGQNFIKFLVKYRGKVSTFVKDWGRVCQFDGIHIVSRIDLGKSFQKISGKVIDLFVKYSPLEHRGRSFPLTSSKN